MSKVDEVVAPTTPAPPAYNSEHTLANVATASSITVPTLDGRVNALCGFDILHHAELRGNDRKVILRDQNTGRQDYVVLFELQASSHDVRKMIIRRLLLHSGDEDSPMTASAAIPATDDVLGVISHNGNKIKVVEHRSKASIRASQAAAVKGDTSSYYFEVGDLEWRLSKKYLHSGKGKSRAGDLELVDRDGNAVAIFLNDWNGSEKAEHLGELYLTSMMTTSHDDAARLLPMAILSALLVVLRMSYRNRDTAKGFIRDLAVGTAAACSVM